MIVAVIVKVTFTVAMYLILLRPFTYEAIPHPEMKNVKVEENRKVMAP